jgi:nucleoid DNA-binding protein
MAARKSNKKQTVDTPTVDTPPVDTPTVTEKVEEQTSSDEVQVDGCDADKKQRVMNSVSKEFLKLVVSNMPSSTNMSAKDIKTVCEVFVKSLVSHVKTGGTVSFTNNMTFKRVTRDNRTHKNPKTGEEVFKPTHYVMVMEVKQALKKQYGEIPVVSTGGKESEDAAEIKSVDVANE